MSNGELPQGSGATIRCRGISRDFEAGGEVLRVLHGIDLDIRPGELTYLIGESGSGKTTLISIIAGILYPTEGTVEIFDSQLYAMRDRELVHFRRDNIGFIFQQYNLIPTVSAAANAAVPLLAQGMEREQALDRATEMLAKLNIADQAKKLPGQLSGGQQQRVAIARALVHEPRLVVCDEPTAALDARSGRAVADLLRQVALAPDRSVVIVTHDNRIFDLADRMLIIEDGRIQFDGNHLPDQEH